MKSISLNITKAASFLAEGAVKAQAALKAARMATSVFPKPTSPHTSLVILLPASRRYMTRHWQT